ncbi:MAG: DUF1559 domain-containing protein [Gemmataceae bacterium]
MSARWHPSPRRLGVLAAAATILGLTAPDGPPRVAWADVPRPAAPEDLIPRDAAAFVHVRVRDLAATATGRALLDGAPAVATRTAAAAGVAVADVECVSLVWLRAAATPATLITTIRPYDRAKVTATVAVPRAEPFGAPEPKWVPPDEAGRFAPVRRVERFPGPHVYDLRDGGVLVLIDARTFGLFPGTTAAAYLPMALRRAADGPLAEGLKLLGPGVCVAAAVDPPTLPYAEDAAGQALRGATAATLRVTGDAVEAVVRYPDAERSAVAARELTAGWPGLLAKLGPAASLAELARGAAFKAEGTTVRAAAALKPATVTAAVKVIDRAVETGGRAADNLKNFVLAMYNYEGTNGRLPPHARYAPDEKTPLLSWRVAVLPYLGEDDIYRRMKLDEPWDSPHNRQFIAKMPKIYESPTVPPKEPGRTPYQVFVGPQAPWQRGPKTMQIPATFRDGAANTIMVAEAAQFVIWTKPDDIEFDPTKPMMPKLGADPKANFLIGMADGTVRVIKRTTSEKTLKAAITPAAGDTLGPDW